jgi:hypothetical protein
LEYVCRCIYLSFKKWKSLYCSGVVALKSSMCSCIKKEHDLGESYFFLVVCAVVCAFMICIIVSYGTTVFFHGRAGCVVCMVDLYIFSI